MSRILLSLFATVFLVACQTAPVTDEKSTHSRLPAGTLLVLHQAITVPDGHARVFMQNGKIRAKHKLDMYYPHCNFEIERVSDGSIQIAPGEFTITHLSLNEEMVVQGVTPPKNGLIKVSSVDGMDTVTLINRLIHHWLDAPAQPDLRRLTCHGGFAEVWNASYPSVYSIRHSLGEMAEFKTAQ